MDEQLKQQIGKALGQIPQGVFVMTSHHEERFSGVGVSWVQQVSFEPPMVMVALHKGRTITPLILESRAFALCQIGRDDRMLLKHFAEERNGGDDPFEGLEIARAESGSPIITRSAAFLDCRVVRHIDIDADHDLYIGRVLTAQILNPGEVHVHLREDGFSY